MSAIFKDPAFQDFRNFLNYTWVTLGLPQPTPLQYDMADALQNIVKPLLGLPIDPEFPKNFPQYWDEGNPEEGREPGPSRRALLSAFRGIGKSWITGALVDWCLGWKPSLNIMVVSGSSMKALEFSQFAKRLIETLPVLKPLIADVTKGQRWSNVSFDVGPAPVSQAASVRSGSITGTLTGGRADLIIPDDVETPNTSETQTAREKLGQRVKEFAAIIKPNGVIIYLGTPQCEDSTYTHLERRGYRRLIWPARFPSDKWMQANGHCLAPSVAKRAKDNPALRSGYGMDGTSGAPTDTRFNELDLQDREAEYGRSGFALQFMLDTSLSDADRYPLKLRDLIVMDLQHDVGPERPLWSSSASDRIRELPTVGLAGDGFYRPQGVVGKLVPYQSTVLAVDPAGRGADELAYAVVKQLNGFFFVMAVGGIKGEGYDDASLAKIAKVAKKYGANKIILEANFGDGMFEALLKPVLRKIYPCTIEEVRHSKQKEKRIIETLEPAMNQHRVVVDATVIHSDRVPHDGEASEVAMHRQLFHQMTRITFDRGALKHDDRLDALSMAVAFFTKAAALDADTQREAQERREWLQRIKEARESTWKVRSTRGNPRRPQRKSLGYDF